MNEEPNIPEEYEEPVLGVKPAPKKEEAKPEPIVPKDLRIKEPKGFKRLTEEQKTKVIKKKEELDEALAEVGEMTPEEKKAMDEQEKEIMGKYLLRDMPLFKYEIIIYFAVCITAFMLSVLDRVGLTQGLLGKVMIPLLVIPIAVWFVKWQFYMPSKFRVPSMRLYKSGIVELGVEAPA